MPVFVDPKSGERFANVPDEDIARAQQEYGLIPEAEFQSRQGQDSKSFGESAGESVQAFANTIMRPLEAIGEALPRSEMARIGERVGDSWSPSSGESRQIAQEHPIASALPLAGEALLPGGPLVQAAAGTIGAAAEGTFQHGGEYGEVDPSELAMAAGMSVLPIAGGAAVRRLGQTATAATEGISKGLRGAGKAAGEKLAELGAGKVGQFAKDEAVDYAVNAATGGLLPRFARGAAGRAIKKLLRGGEDLTGTGLQRWQQFEGLTPEMLGAARPAINPESVAIGTGFGEVFERAAQEASPAFKRAKELIERARARADQTGSVALKGGWETGNARVDAGLRDRLERVLKAAEEAGGAIDKRRLGWAAGLQHQPDWEVETLERQGILRKAPKSPKDPVDTRYEFVPQTRSKPVAAVAAEARGSESSASGEAKFALGGPGFRGQAKLLRGSASKYGAEARDIADTAVRGKSLKELGALDDGFREGTIPWLKNDPHFREHGTVADNFGASDGGLPQFTVEADGRVFLSNGRHRLIAARELGLDSIEGVIRKWGPRGGEKWVYRGPIKIQPMPPESSWAERGFASVGEGPNFSLGDIAKSPMGVVTGLGAAGLAGNVLARAERRANEAVSFDDLDDLSEPDRRAALVANGKRYTQQANQDAVDALDAKTSAFLAARDSARARLGEAAGEPTEAQRAYADQALGAIDIASSALRTAGDAERASKLSEYADRLTEVSVAHQQHLPVDHDPGKLLDTLEGARATLGANQAALPTEAQDALTELTKGTADPALWGDAAGILLELRAADDSADAENVLDTSDPDRWRDALREHLLGARQQADVFARLGVDTEKLEASIDKLSEAVDRGDAVSAELKAAGVADFDAGAEPGNEGPMGEILAAAAREAGFSGPLDEVLNPSLKQALQEQQRAYRYDTAIRAAQRGAEVAIKKAARGAVGWDGAPESDADAVVTAFSEGYEDEVAAFEARRDLIQRISDDPMALASAMTGSYGELGKTHPEVFDEMSSMVSRAASTLVAAMPPSMLNSLQNPTGLLPSVDDVRAFARVYMTVTEPTTFLHDLGAGQAWPEQSQAFARMYPGQWQALSEQAVMLAKERGPALSPQDATYLDITFGIGNTIGGLWSDAAADSIRSAIAQAEEEKQQQQSKPQPQKPGSGMPTSATAPLLSGPSNVPVS